MKKLIYLILPAFVLVLASCSDNITSEENQAEFKFQKELTIQDDSGNSADLIIYANTEEILADQTADVLYLTATNKDFSKTSLINEEYPQGDEVEDVEYVEELEDVFVMVKSFNMQPGNTGFSVRSTLENPLSGGLDARATHYYYAYGSSGVNGVSAEYVSQSCDKEYLATKLSRKKNSSSLFWVSMGKGELEDPGDTWTCTSSSTYYKYKFRIKNKKYCSGTTTYDYNWVY